MSKKKTYEELEEYIRELEAKQKSRENREYKSRLFSYLFGNEENKKWTLSLYNAIHGTSYDDLSCITINTIEDVVYMGMKNDLSMLVSDTASFYQSLELYEQQSTFCPNMPVREFMYAGKLYDKYIYSNRLNRYGRLLMPLPLPKLIVFYNGTEDREDEMTLHLSDAFREEIRRNVMCSRDCGGMSDAEISAEAERIFQEASPDIEVRVRMVNINHGHSGRLLSACRPLGEYSWFVAQVRSNRAASNKGGGLKKMEIGDAIDKALDDMPQDFEIKKFMTANRAEVKDMCLTEYNETETMELLRQEGIQEGIQEGKYETMLLNIRNLMDSMGWDAEKTMDSLKIPTGQRASLYASLEKDL